MKKTFAIFMTGMLMFGVVGMAQASPIFWGPTPYLSSADIPTGFYDGAGPAALEDFEDSTLGFGMTASAGFVIDGPTSFGSVDSVGGGDGMTGHSWVYSPDPAELDLTLTFTFAAPVTAAGMVWTDGGWASFEAFRGLTSLGSIGPFTLGDGAYWGETAEDRFFGVQDLDGITSIAFHYDNMVEVDHVQFGSAPIAPVPEPATMLLLGSGIAGLAGLRRRASKV